MKRKRTVLCVLCVAALLVSGVVLLGLKWRGKI